MSLSQLIFAWRKETNCVNLVRGPERPYGPHRHLNAYEVLLNEAYNHIPEDQTALVRDLLSGLENRDMALLIAAFQHETV